MVNFKGSPDIKKWLSWIGNSEHRQEDLPEAIAYLLYTIEKREDCDLYKAVVNLCEKHDPIVQKLGFFINTYFTDKHQAKGD